MVRNAGSHLKICAAIQEVEDGISLLPRRFQTIGIRHVDQDDARLFQDLRANGELSC